MEEQDYATTYRLEGENWWFVGTRRICREWLERCGARGPILDVGCGTGINMDMLDELGPTTGIDVSAIALRFCGDRGRSDLVQAAGQRLPFPDGSFGLVAAIDVVEHIEADQDAVAEWARVVAPGGHVLVFTSAYQWMWSGHDVTNHHARRYRASEVRALLEGAGLVDVRVSHANMFLFPPIAVLRLIQRLVRRGQAPAPHKDTAEVPEVVNRLLTGLLAVEARLLRHVDLPVGVSIAASGRRPT